MICYKKQECEKEGAIFIEDAGWFLREEIGDIPALKEACEDYYVTYKLKHYITDELYESEEKTPSVEDCLLDGDRHIGFYCYGAAFVFDSERMTSERSTRKTRYLPTYKRGSDTVMPHVDLYHSEKYIKEYLKTHSTVGDYLFYSYPMLEELVIPEGVEVIESCAFGYCVNLKRIVLPSSLKVIGENAFSDCKGLDEVYITGATEVKPNAFGGCDHLTVSFGPEAKLAYSAFGIYERHEKIGGSAYWANYGFDHYGIEKLYFKGNEQEYKTFLAENKDLAEYLAKGKVKVLLYSKTPLEGAWHSADGIPAEW